MRRLGQSDTDGSRVRLVLKVTVLLVALSIAGSLARQYYYRDAFTELSKLSNNNNPAPVSLKQVSGLSDGDYASVKIRGRVAYLNRYAVVFQSEDGIQVLGAITLKAHEEESPKDGSTATALVVVGARLQDSQRMASRLMIGSKVRKEWSGRPIVLIYKWVAE